MTAASCTPPAESRSPSTYLYPILQSFLELLLLQNTWQRYKGCWIQFKMNRLKLGLLLTIMMFGHNFVLNQTQTMQTPLENTFQINVTSFNLLYSIPSAFSIIFIIPMGFFYQKIANKLLWGGAITLSLGQLCLSLFSGQNKPFYFQMMMVGRVFEGIGAEILYMIQGNMASSWMGKYAGIVFILPEVGQILNVLVTPITYTNFGIKTSFFIGFLTCLASTIACILIYYGLKKSKQEKNPSQQDVKVVEMSSQASTELGQLQTHPQFQQKSERENQFFEETNPHPTSIFKAGKIFWLVIVLCGINECLYFPFLDNINELITNRFCIPYENTGYFLSIPFLAAMITSAVSSRILPKLERHKLILYVSIIPLIGHSIIYLDINCEGTPTVFGQCILVLGFIFFGLGIGTYYSVSFPAVGLSVPAEIRGMAYACMGFFQTISMTLIPILVGMIIESEQKITKLSQGYKQQSLLFVSICITGVIVSYLIYKFGDVDSFIYNDEEQMEGGLNEEQKLGIQNRH